MRLQTVSSTRCFRRCPRAYFFCYILGYRPMVDDEVRRFGSLFHAGREAWMLARKAGLFEDEWLAAALKVISREKADPFDVVRVEELMRGYHYRWCSEQFEVLEVEAEFRSPLVNPDTGAASRTFTQAGKLDAIIRQGGRVMVDELKTSSEDVSTGSDYWKRLRLDGQVSAYFSGAAAIGHQVEGCMYDVVRKPSQRPFKATLPESRKYTKDGKLYANMHGADETPEEYRLRVREVIASEPERYYSRSEVVRFDKELADYQQDAWQTAVNIRESISRNVWPRNTGGCMMYGGTCDYWPICTGEKRDDEYRKLDWVHPELSEDTV